MISKDDLQSFYYDFFQDILEEASSTGTYNEDAFFSLATEDLIWAGVIPGAERMQYYRPQGGIRVDGFCGDPLQYNETGETRGCVLSLIVLDLHQKTDMATLTQTDMNADFRRLEQYLRRSLDSKFRNSLEVTNPGYDLACLIADRWERVYKVKLYLLTNKMLSERVSSKASESFDGREITYDVWDIRSFYQLSGAAAVREPLVVDFTLYDQGPLRALLASDRRAKEPVYLAAFPGDELARIYDKWGTRLLEQNVRVFLQARGKVNKGIRNTLENDPGHFFAFNNGITGTAEGIATEQGEDGLVITSLDNFQIVNGGQTTASVHAAFKRGVDLSRVFVQAKITIVEPQDATKIVPKISEYANSQNRVSSADFFANHAYHITMEKLSRSIYAPQKSGELLATRWFYERARGSYRDELASQETQAKKKHFQLEFPRNQVFSKTDLAKYLMVWTDNAYIVNRGAQKNFLTFAEMIGSEWERSEDQFNERYFKEVVAKKIIFNTTERIVQSRDWYEAGGYRSQHVVLTLGLVWYATKRMNKSIDFQKVWNEQQVGRLLTDAIGAASDCVHTVLMNPKTGYRNISEWAKQESCWKAVKATQPKWEDAFVESLVSLDVIREEERSARKDQRELSEIEDQTKVFNAGSEFWLNISNWLKMRPGAATDKELSILRLAVRIDRGEYPSEKQCAVLVTMMRRLNEEGCPYHIDEEKPRRGRRSRRVGRR